MLCGILSRLSVRLVHEHGDAQERVWLRHIGIFAGLILPTAADMISSSRIAASSTGADALADLQTFPRLCT